MRKVSILAALVLVTACGSQVVEFPVYDDAGNLVMDSGQPSTETGTDSGTDSYVVSKPETGPLPDTDSGLDSSKMPVVDSGIDSPVKATPDSSTDSGLPSDSGSHTDSDSDSGSGSGSGSSSGSGSGSSTGSGSGSGSGSSTGSGSGLGSIIVDSGTHTTPDAGDEVDATLPSTDAGDDADVSDASDDTSVGYPDSGSISPTFDAGYWMPDGCGGYGDHYE